MFWQSEGNSRQAWTSIVLSAQPAKQGSSGFALSTCHSFHAWHFSLINLIVVDCQGVPVLWHYSGLKVNQTVWFWVQFLMKEPKAVQWTNNASHSGDSVFFFPFFYNAYSVSRLLLTANFGCTGKTKTPGWTALRQMNGGKECTQTSTRRKQSCCTKSAVF